MVSKWAGMVRQIDGSDYPMAMTLGDKRIEVEYPTLGCGGTLTPVKLDGGLFQTIEHIERGMGQCDEGIRIVFKAGQAKRLDAEFFKWGRLVARGSMVSSPDFPPERSFPTDHTIPDTWVDFGPHED